MSTTLSAPKTFEALVDAAPNGGVTIDIGFDLAAAWGSRARYHVGGAINGRPVRGVVSAADPRLILGPAWCRDCRIGPGDAVRITLALEGPEKADLSEDFVAALEAEPAADLFFQDLAQFYRKAYVAWIEGAKRKPEERSRRIAETIRLLNAGQKARPK